ncbi:MAG: hypothetical protein GX096_04725 [Clostridiales bacterium]|nr:hypothetical protein [Clostridiales bacterium]
MQTPTKGKAENRNLKPLHLTKQIGQTTYKVNVHFSVTSKETKSDKIIRLIENEAVN